VTREREISMPQFPIPAEALDDRLGFIGTSGSGKTYNAGAAVERLLAGGARVVIVDPLDVWWGLRLKADGAKAAFQLPIFGGAHGDLPLNERAGKLIGETVATMSESCIVSVGHLPTKEAERRFMVDFLEALYRKASGSPFHIIFDEADLWAPQGAGTGSGPKLQALMENIVRRGRVKGFIPWLITQRPAVISKDVLSQVDGLVAFKLTSSHDRKAIGEWVKGQADLDQWAAIWSALPTMQKGEGVVWVPGRGILETARFPLKATFDSSKAPTREERRQPRQLKPLDVDALKGRLASIEEEAKANDPQILKAEIARLTAAAARPAATPTWPDQRDEVAQLRADLATAGDRLRRLEQSLDMVAQAVALWVNSPAAPVASAERAPAKAAAVRPAPAKPAPRPDGGAMGPEGPQGPQREVLRAMAWWAHMGHDQPTRAQVCAILGWNVTSGHIKNVSGKLKTAGLLEYPEPGRLRMTDAGSAVAPDPDTSLSFHGQLRSSLSGPQRLVYDHLLEHGEQSRADVCAALGWDPSSGHIKNVAGSLKTLQIVRYPQPGQLALEPWAKGIHE
jgi:hypothetical protein